MELTMNQLKGIDSVLKCAGTKPGIEIWMIENQELLPQPKSLHGDFYTERSYIILISRRKDHGLDRTIHFWLGKETSKADAGVAAYKTFELDEMFGGCTTQYREVQGYESREFCQLFPRGIRYFFMVEKTSKGVKQRRFFQVKGKRYVRVTQVASSYSSMNKGDAFVLDDDFRIFCWYGSESSEVERVKAAEVAKRIRNDERAGRAEIIIIEEGMNPASEDDFFTSLGSRGEIKTARSDEQEFEDSYAMRPSLYKVTMEDDGLFIDEIDCNFLTRESLDSKACFIVDTGPRAVFFWVGKNCTKNEKKAAMANAMVYVKTKKYPVWTQVIKIMETAETVSFKQYFAPLDKKAAGDEVEDEMVSLNTKSFGLLSTGSNINEIQIWLITDSYKQKVGPCQHGVFFEEDCYVLKHSFFQNDNKEIHIMWYWQGKKSSDRAKSASRELAKELDRDANKEAILARVNQGAEPCSFMRLFKNGVIILQGSFKNASDGRLLSTRPSFHSGATKLFQFQQTLSGNTRIIQVDVTASSLDSNDAFVLLTGSFSLVWEGKEADDQSKQNAEDFASMWQQDGDLVIIQEGFESDEIWKLFGGEGHYITAPRSKVERRMEQPRLFQCSDFSGKMQITEIRDFDQQDLCEDDVMILDAYFEIIIWIGKKANEKENEHAFTISTKIMRSAEHDQNRERGTITEVKQQFEPASFTKYFSKWDSHSSNVARSYEVTLAEIVTENAKAVKDCTKYNTVYSYKELKRMSKADDFDICKKEMYLSDAEFLRVFGMSKVEFYKKPKWKQVVLKKQMGLH